MAKSFADAIKERFQKAALKGYLGSRRKEVERKKQKEAAKKGKK